MTRYSIATLCVASLALAGLRVPVAADAAADREAIRSHIDRIFNAYIAKNRAEVQATHDREWRGFLTGSRRIIRGLDEYMRGADSSLASPNRLVGYVMEDFDVQFRGPDLAVVPYIAELEGEAEGARSKWKLRVIDVYERQNGEWMQIASNTAMHPQSTFEQASEHRVMLPGERAELMKAREAVWRAWFGGDTAQLTTLLPPELITIEPAGAFGNLKTNLDGARGFAAGGGKLTRLVFPKTEFQAYGATVILYTTYEMDLVSGGKASTQKGAATEVFVRQPDGRWVNSGWQLAPSTR